MIEYRVVRLLEVIALASALSFGTTTAVRAQASSGAAAMSPTDADIQAEVINTLDNKKFSNVKVAAEKGMVRLTGTVDLYTTKEEADKRAHHSRNVLGVENLITVAGPAIDDETLRTKLAEKLSYDRVGYGTTAFNSFTIGVQNGAVTLGGVAYGPTDKDSALSLVANYPGVKDLIDNVEVAPVSPMDDRIRIAVARAVYGAPSLNRYAIDPAKPIRITVVHGDVTLSGMVDRQADKDVAGIRANGVSGVFKVTNNLEVAGSPPHK